MRILALESSGLAASVAVVEEDKTVAEYTVNYKKTHSQTLLPMLDEAAGLIELDLNTIDAIAVSGGPGSFTGLRIGSASAKGLGLALGKPLIHIPTLHGLAYNLYGNAGLVCPMMDARRSQVYTGLFSFRDGFKVLKEQAAVDVSEWIEELNRMAEASGEMITVLGDGVPAYYDKLEAGFRMPHCYAPPHMNRQRAASIGALGIQYYLAGSIETAGAQKPDYLRVSQAERERMEQENRKQGEGGK